MVDATVRYDLTDAHVATLGDAYRETWFGEDWDGDTIEDLLDGTDALVVLTDAETGDLLAFAHALTDYATVAFVRDVVVREPYRGDGLGRRLVAELRDHPDLADVDQFAVTCPEDLAPFYEACGFERREGGEILVVE